MFALGSGDGVGAAQLRLWAVRKGKPREIFIPFHCDYGDRLDSTYDFSFKTLFVRCLGV